MIILSIITTLIVGFIGMVLGVNINIPEMGSILAITTMGAFIIAEIKRNNRKCE